MVAWASKSSCCASLAPAWALSSVASCACTPRPKPMGTHSGWRIHKQGAQRGPVPSALGAPSWRLAQPPAALQGPLLPPAGDSDPRGRWPDPAVLSRPEHR
jgi:hypothetical protein